LRERELVLRLRVVLRAGFLAVPVDAFAVERLGAGLRAADVRLAPEVDALARAELAFFAPLLRLAVERFAVERLADVLRVPPLRDAADDERALLALGPSSALHLPDITRCAASATASAMSEPSLVSRIARRALGLALIAAAAAASPAASISLLIAALASLSTVSLPEEEPEDPLRADFAIASTPCVAGKDTSTP
jgi:hypothetical protein